MSTLIVDLSHAWRPARAGLDFVLSQDGASVSRQDGASVSRQGNAAPALLPAATELIAVVPPQALSWHAVRLPEGLKLHARSDASKLRTALIGLMEEQLLADPDTLHLAVFDHPTPQHLWVAVCDATALRAALQVLELAGRVVHRVVPAYSPAYSPAYGPEDTPTLHVSGEGGSQLVLRHPGGVLCLPGSDEAWRLVLNLPIVGDASTLQITAEPAAIRQAEHKSGRAVTLLTPAQHVLSLMASPFNLAQHAFAQSRRLRWQKQLLQSLMAMWQARAWRPARVGLVLVLLVNLVGVKLLAWHEQSLLQAQRAQAAQLLQTTFPEVKLVVDAPLQMARSLAQLQQGSAIDLSLALQTVTQVVPTAKVTGLVFSTTDVRLQGLALDAAQSSQLQAAFKAVGLVAQAAGSDWVLGSSHNAGGPTGASAGGKP
jgi:general secretion pathway protein L